MKRLLALTLRALFHRRRCAQCLQWRRLYFAERSRVESLTNTYLARYGVQDKPFEELPDKGVISAEPVELMSPERWAEADEAIEIAEKAALCRVDADAMRWAEEAAQFDPQWRKVCDKAKESVQ